MQCRHVCFKSIGTLHSRRYRLYDKGTAVKFDDHEARFDVVTLLYSKYLRSVYVHNPKWLVTLLHAIERLTETLYELVSFPAPPTEVYEYEN